MKMKLTALVFIVFVLFSLALSKAEAACDIQDLKVCLPAVIGGSPPTTECCTKLKDNQSCLCDYLKNPLVVPYKTSAKQVFEACGIPVPVC
ncbi:PREDICTED: probable non-specific lipid-transfer protein AKCS9 [Camelina sativa]|uniref:Probable non-specific lipid-transfer protein AKCS9 n=1 Tax=Camelina sativa TaxID=90675 RepID=A0ABM1QJ64_CAMSA|nr:PREDICTED: probable non-specific lipid-transfer protein AKCS9 [Camelina sativa]